MLAAAVLTTGIIAPFAAAGDENWIKDDYDKAMKVAKEKNLPVLIDFTGSDWCGWCIRLKDEVFTQSMFKETAPEKFVLLELDYPTDKVPQTPEVKARNKELAAQYEIKGYPTIMLTDSNGVAFAQTGYRPDGPAPYLEHLDALIAGKAKRDALLAEAAKLMDEALGLADEGLVVPNRMAMMEQIISFDADNAAGLKEKYESQITAARAEKRMSDIQTAMGEEDGERVLELIAEVKAAGLDPESQEMQMIAFFEPMAMAMTGKIDEAMAVIDAKAADMVGASPEDMQQALVGKVSILMQSGDVDRLTKELNALIAVAPESELSTMIKNDMEQIIDQTKQMKAEKDAKNADG